MQCGMQVIVLFVLANDKYNNSRHVHAGMSVGMCMLLCLKRVDDNIRVNCGRSVYERNGFHGIFFQTCGQVSGHKLHTPYTHTPYAHSDHRHMKTDRHSQTDTPTNRHCDSDTVTQSHRHGLSLLHSLIVT